MNMTQEEERLRAEVARLEEESRQWDKASLVKLLRERDQLRETIAGQETRIDSLRKYLSETIASKDALREELDNLQHKLNVETTARQIEAMDSRNELIKAQARIAELEGWP
jgi:uncharacterized coiled-coil protein SlyX